MKAAPLGLVFVSVGTLAGWYLGRSPGTSVPVPSALLSAESALQPLGADSHQAMSRVPADAGTLALLTQVREASPAELKALLARHLSGAGFRDHAVAILAAQRLRDSGAVPDALPMALNVHREWLVDRLSALAERDPQAALALDAEYGVDSVDSGEWRAIAAGWARRDVPEATEWALSLPLDARRTALDQIADVVVESSLDAARAWVETLPAVESSQFAAERVAQEWAKTSPREAVAWLMARPGHADRGLGFIGTYVLPYRSDWSAREVMDIFAYRKEEPYPPDKAISQHFSEQGDAMAVGEPVGTEVGVTWPDPRTAAADLSAMPCTNMRQRLLRSAVRQWAAADRESVFAAAEKATDPWTRLAFFNGLLAVEGIMDTPETLARLTALAPGDSAAEGLTTRYWVKRATDAPAEAERLLAEGAPPAAAVAMARHLAAGRADADAAAAVTWAVGLPGEAQESALNVAARRWAEDDPVATTAWLATQPAGAGRDMAIRAAIGGLEPPEALPWAESISDPATREQAVRQYLLSLDGPKSRALRLVETLRTATPEFKDDLRRLLHDPR